MAIKAVVFDAYGTLFDVYAIQVLAEALYPGHGSELFAQHLTATAANPQSNRHD